MDEFVHRLFVAESFVRSFPFDKIKIDRSLVRGLSNKAATAAAAARC